MKAMHSAASMAHRERTVGAAVPLTEDCRGMSLPFYCGRIRYFRYGKRATLYQSQSVTYQMKPMDFFVWQDG
jgi:hypothetical protein